MAFQWTCPFCNHHQMGSEANSVSYFTKYDIGASINGDTGFKHAASRCLNPECNEVTLVARFVKAMKTPRGEWRAGNAIDIWQLRPRSSSKPQPDYIPSAIREDYFEACLIRDTSPKASATLARRCLQGMIRDFAQITKNRLIDEIKELNKRLEDGTAPRGVEPETIEAIDAIRNVGNIGAHMEKDINLIIDVDPGEAQAMIELIEMLFEEWYVARHKREQRLAAVKAIAVEKRELIASGAEQIAQARIVAADEADAAADGDRA